MEGLVLKYTCVTSTPHSLIRSFPLPLYSIHIHEHRVQSLVSSASYSSVFSCSTFAEEASSNPYLRSATSSVLSIPPLELPRLHSTPEAVGMEVV